MIFGMFTSLLGRGGTWLGHSWVKETRGATFGDTAIKVIFHAMSLLVQKAERFYLENFPTEIKEKKIYQHQFTYLINACMWVCSEETSTEPNLKLFTQFLMADT